MRPLSRSRMSRVPVSHPPSARPPGGIEQPVDQWRHDQHPDPGREGLDLGRPSGGVVDQVAGGSCCIEATGRHDGGECDDRGVDQPGTDARPPRLDIQHAVLTRPRPLGDTAAEDGLNLLLRLAEGRGPRWASREKACLSVHRKARRIRSATPRRCGRRGWAGDSILTGTPDGGACSPRNTTELSVGGGNSSTVTPPEVPQRVWVGTTAVRCSGRTVQTQMLTPVLPSTRAQPSALAFLLDEPHDVVQGRAEDFSDRVGHLG